LEKDNFTSKYTKAKEKFRLCLAGIQKQTVNIKKFNKNKICTLSSLEYLIFLGEHLNKHIFSPILACPFLSFLAKFDIFANLLSSFDKYIS
jgi:hypothetical protein